MFLRTLDICGSVLTVLFTSVIVAKVINQIFRKEKKS